MLKQNIIQYMLKCAKQILTILYMSTNTRVDYLCILAVVAHRLISYIHMFRNLVTYDLNTIRFLKLFLYSTIQDILVICA